MRKKHFFIRIIFIENNNDIMDFGLFHIPKEGYGLSNNAKDYFGPPDFNKAKFYFSHEINKISIYINY